MKSEAAKQPRQQREEEKERLQQQQGGQKSRWTKCMGKNRAKGIHIHVSKQDSAGTCGSVGVQEGAQTLTQAGAAAISSSQPSCPSPGCQPGTAPARDLPENSQGTHSTPLTQPSPVSTAATLTEKDPHDKDRQTDPGCGHPHSPQSSSVPGRGGSGRTHVQTQPPSCVGFLQLCHPHRH